MSKEGPDLVAAMDQVGRLSEDIAELLFKYYRNMRKAGFSRKQAFTLTLAFQAFLNQSPSE